MLLILVMAGLGLASAVTRFPGQTTSFAPRPPGREIPFPTRRPMKQKEPGSYFISFPRDVHRGMPFNVNVDILNATYPVKVRVELQRVWYNLTQYYKLPLTYAERDFVQGTTGVLQLTAPTKTESGRYILHVRGSGGLQFEREKDVSFTYKSITIMIQTDKAMYKPGQKVRFRVVGWFPNLQIYTGKFQVTITDPNWNKIKLWLGLQSGTGVVVGEFQLADRTVFGDWRISVQAEEQVARKTQTFTVAEYKLPRFEVTVDLPKFAVTSDEMLTGTVKAKYTFGKPVKGMVELRASIDTYQSPCGPPPKYVQQAFPIDSGEATFNIPLVDLKRLRFSLERQTVEVVAIVKEELTGVRLNGSSSVEFHKYAYKIEILPSSPKTFSPKLSYSAIVKVSRPDGRPLGVTAFPVSFYTCVKYHVVLDDQSLYGCREFSGSYGLPGQNHSLPLSGILPVHMAIPENATILELKAHYREVSDTYTVKKRNSLSSNYMQIRMATSGIKAGQSASFTIEYTEPVPSFTYQIISRGAMVLSADLPTGGMNPVIFQVPITHAMAPVAYILVYYVRDSGEVVADSISFTVNEVFDNEVSVVFSRNVSLPNQGISVVMTADPLSSVNLLAIDQSVLLLKSGNDITTEKVLDELKTYGSSVTNGEFSPEVFAIASSAGRAPEIFSGAGLNVITDARYYDHFYPEPQYNSGGFGGYAAYSGRMARGGTMNFAMSAPTTEMTADSLTSQKVSAGPQPPGLKKVDRVRNVFPETWLWLSQSVGQDGRAVVTSTVPDTITTWVASAFAVHPVSGLGVAPEAAKLRVFQTFFVSLTMPTSVLRGETVIIQASIFNYLQNDVDVSVSMPPSPDYVNVVFDPSGKLREESKFQNLNLRVKSNQPRTVYFPVIPKTIGTITIEVAAQSASAADAVKRQLVVHSEGIRKEYNIPLFVGLPPGENFRQTQPLNLPAETVRGSEKARVKVTGNLIGSSLDNIENLLAMPMACGEQNMMTFAPNVYIGDYLIQSRQMTPAMMSKIISLLELGLQRQLTFQRTDGSFSPFGNRDEAGSMWLTAFVSLSFHEARRYILVDNSTLTRAVNWMIGRQNKDGSFNEPGLVIDRKTQRSRSTLTAHVLLALMENRDIMEPSGPNKAYKDALENAVRYLEKAAPLITDLYDLAVVSYALTKAGSPVADVPFNRLDAAASYQGKLKYWTEQKPSTPTTSPPFSSYYKTWFPPHVPAQPLDIQITSYALLSYIARNNITDGFTIAMWLSTQRNPNGGFSSSQDTMVALRALTGFTQRIRMSPFEVYLNFTGVTDFIQVAVTRNNALVLQSREFRTFPNEINVAASGAGVVFSEIDVSFHVNAEIGNPSFEVNAVLLEDSINTYRVMVCTKWLKEDSTGMAVMEVSIASGFEPDMTSVGTVVGIKKVERRGREVNVYFDQISKSTICFNLLATRTGMVSNNQPSYIRVFDYYQPDNQASIFYQPRSLASSTICEVCTDCCPRPAP